jgi:hypothetical protein
MLLISIAPSASAQAADQQAADPDIQHLMELTGGSKAGTMMASLVSSQVLKQMQQQHPEIPARAVDIVRTTLDEEFKVAFAADGPLIRDLGAVWSKHFTHDEVRALIGFYETPLGRKVIDSVPGIMQECAQVGAEWGQQNMPAISRKIQDRLRAEGLIK